MKRQQPSEITKEKEPIHVEYAHCSLCWVGKLFESRRLAVAWAETHAALHRRGR